MEALDSLGEGRGRVSFANLRSADLVPGTIYESGGAGTIGDEPISRLMGCGNMGGFRIVGSPTAGNAHLVVLFTTFADRDWPDELDVTTGRLTYYGDNKKPGRELHDTSHHGNRLLAFVNEFITASPPERWRVPPFFVFSPGGRGRDALFHGLAAPGFIDEPVQHWLVRERRSREAGTFENYQAKFTLLSAPTISRPWIDDLLSVGLSSEKGPDAWRKWVTDGIHIPQRSRD
jgi:hypothetical protein